MRLKELKEFHQKANNNMLLEYLETQNRDGLKSTDVLEIYQVIQNPLEEWDEITSHDQLSEIESTDSVKFFVCKLFNKTVRKREPRVINKIKEFINFKKEKPLEDFGSRDRPYTGESLKRAVRDETMRHVHLTHDISLLYTISGNDTKIIKLYGVFSHDESGTGQPPNINKQQNLADKLSNQTDWSET